MTRSRPALALFGLSVLAGSARADVATEARFFDDVARKAFARQDFDEALDSFFEVNRITRSPRALYNVAVCADLAGKADVAFASYREYLSEDDPDAERHRDAERRLSALKEKLALVEITSTPPGATIYVDRIELGAYGQAPRTIVVPEGARRILVEADGFFPESVPFEAEVGRVAKVDVRLQPRFGDVVVDVTPKDARLEFVRDGEPIDAIHDGNRYRLPVGAYRVRATRTGYSPAESRVVVREGSAADLALAEAPLPEPTGRLLVGAGNVEADVLVDGRRVALTPATLPDVTVGEHRVEVRAKGRAPFTARVVVTEGHATYVEAKLEGKKP
jgi:hypothetical protein